MQVSVFNALPVLAPSAAELPPSAWGITIGDNFLFAVDANQTGNRVTYCLRTPQDKTGGPHPMATTDILKNFTHTIQPVSGGGPYPPSAGGYEVNEWHKGDSIKDPSTGNFGNNTGSIPIPFSELIYPKEDFPGQGGAGFVRINDILTE